MYAQSELYIKQGHQRAEYHAKCWKKMELQPM